MKIEEQNKSSRPSLYGSNATTSSFSVLSTLTPVGWSKQNVVLASVASFIVGGVMGGGVVGLVKQSETRPAVSIISSPLPITQNVQHTAVASAVVNPTVAKVSPPAIVEVEVIKPRSNPLASFTESTDIDRTDNKSIEQKIVKTVTKKRVVLPNDDLAMQKLIKNQSIDMPTLRKEKVEKEKIEAAFMAERPIKTTRATKDNNFSKAKVKPKKSGARDKDVLLVKSMLDTMDHPASKAKSSPKNNETAPPSNK